MGYILLEDKSGIPSEKEKNYSRQNVCFRWDSKISKEKAKQQQSKVNKDRDRLDGDPCSRVVAAWIVSHLNIPTLTSFR